jgi:hypothetical protein
MRFLFLLTGSDRGVTEAVYPPSVMNWVTSSSASPKQGYK